MSFKNSLKFVGLAVLVQWATACAQSGGVSESAMDKYGRVPFKTYPLLWESTQPNGNRWSGYTLQVIHEEAANDLLPGAEDMDLFCPEYPSLATNERANFWALLISAMTKFESGQNPVSRMEEKTMGKDPVTGKAVFSEGLMQLSYQDIRHYSFCEFDWSRDRSLSPIDPDKSILDPYKNLRCGIKILASQIRSRYRISVGSGAYWAVLKTNNHHHKIEQIAALTKKMPGCMKGP